MKTRAIFLFLVGLANCGPNVETDDDTGHHECPEPAPLRCEDMSPERFDAWAECERRIPGSTPSTWWGRMCSSDGCPGYPPEDADFEVSYLCDGQPVELWCVCDGCEP